MGDCLLRILQSLNGDPPLTELSVLSWSSDSTIFDCFQKVKIKNYGENDERTLWEMVAAQVFSVWDCTKHPAINVTQTCLQSGTQTTLHSAGWFPSGTLQILPADATRHIHASAGAHQDVQFNRQSDELNAVGAVSIVGKTFDDVNSNSGYRPTVAQVLSSVPDRFKDDEDRDVADALLLRRQNKQKQRDAEKERAKKLDARIRRLGSMQTSKTSLQVRKMLIKSRATGRNGLQEEDRVYLHICFDDDERQEDYRFFSKQDTIGAALESFADASGSSNRELLVSLDDSYYRIPSSLRFREAIQRKFLEPGVATVFVRFYSGGEANRTTSINERSAKVACTTEDIQKKQESSETFAEAVTDPETVTATESIPTRPGRPMKQLHDKLLALFPPPRKQTPTFIKVQQMKMKGKATGDAKRIKVSDRFFFELVLVTHQNNEWKVTSKGPVYYALSDPVDRCWRETRELAASSDWTVMVFRTDELRPLGSSIQKSRSQSWETLCSNGKVSQFSILIWLLS